MDFGRDRTGDTSISGRNERARDDLSGRTEVAIGAVIGQARGITNIASVIGHWGDIAGGTRESCAPARAGHIAGGIAVRCSTVAGVSGGTTVRALSVTISAVRVTRRRASIAAGRTSEVGSDRT